MTAWAGLTVRKCQSWFALADIRRDRQIKDVRKWPLVRRFASIEPYASKYFACG